MVNAVVYGDANSFRTQKVLVAARIAGKTVDVKSGIPQNKFALNLTPAYEEGSTLLFGADAIAKHLAKSNSTYVPSSDPTLDQWLWWADAELLPNILAVVLPSLSYAHVDADTLEHARRELHAQLAHFDRHLLTRTFIVGERLSIADVSIALNLVAAYRHVLDTKARKQLVNVTRWFTTVVGAASVHSVIGDVKLADEAATFSADAYKKHSGNAPAHKSGGADDKKHEKKHDKKHDKAEKPAKAPKAEAPAAAAVEEEPEEPKEKKVANPFSLMPAGTFDMDAFKRVYSNEDTVSKAIPYFWEKFEPEHYSIWFGEYKYPEDLTQVFMSCNLINGMFQRLDTMRKAAFGSVALFGESNNSQIAGVWVWRGQELVFPLSPDWQVDYESYKWTKLDPADEKTKKMIEGYFAWEDIEYEGKKFNQGKIFK